MFFLLRHELFLILSKHILLTGNKSRYTRNLETGIDMIKMFK